MERPPTVTVSTFESPRPLGSVQMTVLWSWLITTQLREPIETSSGSVGAPKDWPLMAIARGGSDWHGKHAST